MNNTKEPLKDPPTPEDMTPEQREKRNFKRSPLARRISDDILNPLTTRELLKQKKLQFNQLQLSKQSFLQKFTKTSMFDSLSDPFHTAKMPSIRVLASKIKPFMSIEESSFSDIQAIAFPEISEVFWSKVEMFGWKPETRQHATLTLSQNKLFLLGGVSRSIISDVNVFNIGLKKWEKIATVGVETEPRFGHTVVEHNKKLVVFGGGTDFNSIHKLRECLNGVKAFIPETREWANVRCEGNFIGTRKHHCAAVVGKHMVVHGGLNQRNNFLNDSAVLNLSKNKWKVVGFKGLGPGFAAFHVAVTVLDVDQRNVASMYKLGTSKAKTVKTPGIYVFGGLNENKLASNTLHLLNIGVKVPFWTVPETWGKPPSPRFQHSMVYNEKLNAVVVFGGRIDVSNSSSYTCFNDLFILKMETLTWVTVQVLGNIPNMRSGHCFASAGTKVYLFAGAGTNTYCSSDLYSLELSPKMAKQLIEEEERRKIKEVEIDIIKARRASMSLDDRKLGFY